MYDLGVSDRKVVSMEFKLSHHIKPKRQIYFRNLKHIDTDIMTLDLQQIPPSANFTTVSESVEYYNKTLSTVLDLHAPLKSRTVSFSRSAPWFTSELRSMKAAGRVLERHLARSGLTVHRLA